MSILIKLVINSLAVLIAAHLTPGVIVDSFFSSIVVAITLGLCNTFLKPILIVLTLPINILTLGLFTLVINTFLVLLTASLVSGFQVNGFLAALIFSIILTLVNWFLSSLS